MVLQEMAVQSKLLLTRETQKLQWRVIRSRNPTKSPRTQGFPVKHILSQFLVISNRSRSLYSSTHSFHTQEACPRLVAELVRRSPSYTCTSRTTSSVAAAAVATRTRPGPCAAAPHFSLAATTGHTCAHRTIRECVMSKKSNGCAQKGTNFTEIRIQKNHAKTRTILFSRKDSKYTQGQLELDVCVILSSGKSLIKDTAGSS